MADEKHHTSLIFTQYGIERSIVSCTYPSVDALGTLGSVRRTHHDGAQSGTERQSRNHRNTYGSCHRDTELCIEHARSTSHEGYRNKHSHKYTGTGDNSHRHVAHCIFRGKIRRLVSSIKLGLYRLYHHNGVVYHRTDSKYQSKQCQDVQTEARSHQTGKRTYQRHNDRDGGDQRTLQILQEEIDHEDDQNDGDNQRLHHVVYGSEKEVIGTHHRDELRSCRQILLHPLYLRSDFFVDSGSIGTGCLEYHIKNGRLTVHFTAETIRHRTQLHLCHILQAKYGTVFPRTDNRVPEFFHAFEASAIFHCKLENILRTLAQ